MVPRPIEESEKVYSTCGIPGCSSRKVYNDERYGTLCRKHGHVVVKRRKRGWPDIYEGLETAGWRTGSQWLPKEHHRFWSLVRLFVSGEEWSAMWEWVKGRSRALDPSILEKARTAVLTEPKD